MVLAEGAASSNGRRGWDRAAPAGSHRSVVAKDASPDFDWQNVGGYRNPHQF